MGGARLACILGRHFAFSLPTRLASLLDGSYGAFFVPATPRSDASVIIRPAPGGRHRVGLKGGKAAVVRDLGELLYQVDRIVTVEIQSLRPDLFFVHAAVVENRGRAALLVAASGGGKSTLTWALLHHGFAFASDELAPIAVDALEVYAFPRGLALKADPPSSHPLPTNLLRTSRCIHVPVERLPGPMVSGKVRLAAVFFLGRRDGDLPSVTAISAAEGAARLYANALNALAHSADGLDAAVRVAAAVPCYELRTGELAATAALLRATLRRAARSPRPQEPRGEPPTSRVTAPRERRAPRRTIRSNGKIG